MPGFIKQRSKLYQGLSDLCDKILVGESVLNVDEFDADVIEGIINNFEKLISSKRHLKTEKKNLDFIRSCWLLTYEDSLTDQYAFIRTFCLTLKFKKDGSLGIAHNKFKYLFTDERKALADNLDWSP